MLLRISVSCLLLSAVVVGASGGGRRGHQVSELQNIVLAQERRQGAVGPRRASRQNVARVAGEEFSRVKRAV